MHQERGHAQAARIHQLARKRVAAGQLQRGVAKQLADRAFGRDEVGGAGGVADVLVRRVHPVVVVAVQQRLGRLALDDEGQFPHQVVGVLQARVGAACAKGRYLVRRVARKQQAAMAKVRHAAALKGVNTGPFQRAFAVVAQHGFHTRHDVFGLFLFFRVGVPAQLKVDAPHVVALFVQQHALVGVKRRVEPKPAFGGKVGFHHHIGDQKPVFEHLAVHVQPQLAAHVGARPVGHDQPVGLDVKRTVGRFHAHAGTVGQRLHAHHLVFPAQIGTQFGGALHQRFFQVVLLQVDHARALVARAGHQVEAVHLFLAQKGAAHVPAHALVHHRIAHAQTVQNFQRTLGVTHRPRAKRHAVVFVQQQHIQPMQPRINGRCQPHRPRANDDQRLALRRAVHQVVRRLVRKGGVGVGGHASGAPVGVRRPAQARRRWLRTIANNSRWVNTFL